jgi:hypothetical protein
MRLTALACLALALCAVPAWAEPFQAAYAPHVGQHSDVRIRKCQDTRATEQEPTHTCTTITYDEEIVAGAGDGFRIRYTAQSVEGRDGAALLAQLRATPMDMITDARGAPIAFQNRQEFFQNLRQVLPQDDPEALNAAMAAYGRLDDQTAASTFTTDLAPLSAFQGLSPMNVGEPESHGVSAPFPPLPSQPVDGMRTFQIDGVDTHAGVATAHFETAYSTDSLTRAFAALVARRNHGPPPPNINVRLTERTEGVLDIASGAIKHVHSVRSTDIMQGLNTLMRTVDTVDVDRRAVSR